MNEVPDSANVIGKLLGERERIADEPTAALANRVVETLNVGCLTAVFASGLVPFGRENSCIGGPKIGVADRALAVHSGK